MQNQGVNLIIELGKRSWDGKIVEKKQRNKANLGSAIEATLQVLCRLPSPFQRGGIRRKKTYILLLAMRTVSCERL